MDSRSSYDRIAEETAMKIITLEDIVAKYMSRDMLTQVEHTRLLGAARKLAKRRGVSVDRVLGLEG